MLRELSLPLYDNYKVHFKDLCLKLTKDAFVRALGENADFDKISDRYEQHIEREWIRRHKSLRNVVKLPIDTGMHWAGLFIYKMIKRIREKRRYREMILRKKFNNSSSGACPIRKGDLSPKPRKSIKKINLQSSFNL